MENTNLFLESGPENSKRIVGQTSAKTHGGFFVSPPQIAGPSKPTQMSLTRGAFLKMPSRHSDQTQGSPGWSSTSARFFRPARARSSARLGLGRIAALHHRSSTSHHIR